MSNKTIDTINVTCHSKMNYYNPIDLTKYGTIGVCPHMLYKTYSVIPKHINKENIKTNPCKLDEGLYKQSIHYKHPVYSCHSLKKIHKRKGYSDIPCLKTAYNNTNYYDLNRSLIYFHESHSK
jgi:hypothetical protein